MKNTTVIVTGGNSGIGKATAVELARQGATVVLGCRNPQKAEQAVQEICQQSGNTNVDYLLVDMASHASIREFGQQVALHYPKTSILINNAGALFGKKDYTRDGFEQTFGVNHLGYFLTTYYLLNTLQAQDKARIVNVASDAHWWGWFNTNNLQSEKIYQKQLAYGTSKLCNIMFTFALARRFSGTPITANCLHPGVIDSNFGMQSGGLMEQTIRLSKRFIKTPEVGARTSIFLASSPEVEGKTGGYYHEQKHQPLRPIAKDVAAQEELWQLSAKLCGIEWR